MKYFNCNYKLELIRKINMFNFCPKVININFNWFKLKKIHARVDIRIFGCLIRFLLPHKKELNRYISLGTNCYARYMLSKIGKKPRRKDGELSYPFDLCITTPNNIAKILKNNFEDYVQNIQIATTQEPNFDKYIYRNEKYNINYIHDNNLDTLDKIKNRYNKRIENFKSIAEHQPDIVFLMFIIADKFHPEDINSIYNSLEKYRNSKPFKFAVFYITDNYTNIKDELLPEIIYNEYIPECGAIEYKTNWVKRDSYMSNTIIDKVASIICNL